MLEIVAFISRASLTTRITFPEVRNRKGAESGIPLIKITTLMKHINADEAKTFVHHNHQIHVNPNTTRDDFSLLSVVFV